MEVKKIVGKTNEILIQYYSYSSQYIKIKVEATRQSIEIFFTDAFYR